MVKFEDGTSLVYHGNALQILPTLTSDFVDAILTDPPYSSGAATLSGKQANPANKYQQTGTKKTYPSMLGDCRDQRSFTLWMTLWLSECWRIAKPGAPALVFTDWRQLPSVVDAVQAAGFSYRGVVVWHKRSARPMLGEFRRDSEFIVYGCKPPFARISRKCLPGVFDIPIVTHQKIHVTSKPVALLEALMGIVPEGGTVLDPFLGGGTTAVAAQNTGRRCIAMELSEEYAEIAVERIKGAVNAYKGTTKSTIL